jgi:hypothetical protein
MLQAALGDGVAFELNNRNRGISLLFLVRFCVPGLKMRSQGWKHRIELSPNLGDGIGQAAAV